MNLIIRSQLALGLMVLSAGSFAFAGTKTATLGETDYIINGTVVQAGDEAAASTVLIVGEVPASTQTMSDTVGVPSAVSSALRSSQPSDPSDGQTEEYLCTGSIIAPDMVVTAAHCVVATAQNIHIVFALNINGLTQSEVQPIAGYTANPKWQGDASTGVDQGDIAIIQLAEALPQGYQPATMLPSSSVLKSGTEVEIAGYGITNAKTQAGAGTLRETQIPFMQDLGKTEAVLNNKGTGACHGDSGGPAFLSQDGQLYLWGLTNRGYPDSAPDNCAEEVVYTRIDTYASWIAETENTLRNQ